MPSIRCARCGYENHLHQRFCGMCGNGLASTAPTQVTTSSATPLASQVAVPPSSQVVVEEKPVVVSSGPSFLGLGEPSGSTDYLFEEEKRHGVRRFVFVLAVMLAIACAIWLVRQQSPGWLSAQFAQVKTAVATILGSKPETPTAPASTQSEAPALTSPANAQPQETQPPQTENAASTPPDDGSAAEKPATPPTQAASVEKIPNEEPADGAADVEEGEKYLYGRGVRQDCRRAQGSLMTAADLSNAKAQGILGTMYATGHCVPRDLTTAYHWFLEAKKQDPKNVRYEQDLRLVWRQMTAEQQQQVGSLRP
jgi:hypothetical protein